MKKIPIGLLLTIMIIVVLCVFIAAKMNGSITVITNEGDAEIQKDTLLECSNSDFLYPFFAYDNSVKKTIKISVLFKNNLLSSISLKQNLYYEDYTSVVGSEAHNHAAINISFGRNGLEADSLNAKYSLLEDSMQFVLYATNNDLNSASYQYFLLDDISSSVIDTNAMEQAYEKRGLECIQE